MQGLGTRVMHVLTNNIRRHRFRLAGGASAFAALVYLTVLLRPQFEQRILPAGADRREVAQGIQIRLLGSGQPQIANPGESRPLSGKPLHVSQTGSEKSGFNDKLSRKAADREAPPANQSSDRIAPSVTRQELLVLSHQNAVHQSPHNPCDTETFPKRPPDNLRESFEWQKTTLNGTNTYVFSAHYDSRNGRRAIVVVGISNDYMGPSVNYACQIWFANSDTAEVTPAVTTTHSETHGLKYAATFHICTFQTNESPPIAVSLVTWESRCRRPFNVLSISSYNLSSDPEVNFTVCVTPLNYNFDDFRQLVEMVELNRMFGAQRVIFYNFSTGSHVDSYLRSYVQEDVVVVVPWKLPVLTDVLGSKTEPEIHYFGQLAALNDCLYRNMFRSRFVVMTDMDEVVVPRQHATWMEMVQSQGQGRSSDWQSGIASFHIRNVFFRTDYGEDELYSGHDLVHRFQLRSLLTTTREERTFPHGWRSKHMVNTKVVVFVGIHHIESILDYSRSSVRDVDESTALLHHYRSWAEAETIRQSSRTDRYMHRFNHTILSRVAAVHQTVAARFKGMPTIGELTMNRTQSV